MVVSVRCAEGRTKSSRIKEERRVVQVSGEELFAVSSTRREIAAAVNAFVVLPV